MAYRIQLDEQLCKKFVLIRPTSDHERCARVLRSIKDCQKDSKKSAISTNLLI